MTFSILIGTFGADRWDRYSRERALPSAGAQEDVLEILRHHEPKGTLHDVRNELARSARGEYLVFLDGDDELAPGYTAAMRAALDAWEQEGGVPGWMPLLTPAVVYLPERPLSSRRPPSLRNARIWPQVDLRDGNWLVIGTAVPRALFHEVGGFRDWPLYEDWCLWQRCSLAGADVLRVPEAIYVAYASRQSRNRAPLRRAREEVHHAIRRANFPELYANA